MCHRPDTLFPSCWWLFAERNDACVCVWQNIICMHPFPSLGQKDTPNLALCTTKKRHPLHHPLPCACHHTTATPTSFPDVSRTRSPVQSFVFEPVAKYPFSTTLPPPPPTATAFPPCPDKASYTGAEQTVFHKFSPPLSSPPSPPPSPPIPWCVALPFFFSSSICARALVGALSFFLLVSIFCLRNVPRLWKLPCGASRNNCNTRDEAFCADGV